MVFYSPEGGFRRENKKHRHCLLVVNSVQVGSVQIRFIMLIKIENRRRYVSYKT